MVAHFRYPEDLFRVQTNMYGRYHLTNASDFYSQAQAWAVSPDPGSGQLSQSSPLGQTILGPNGQLVRRSGATGSSPSTSSPICPARPSRASCC